MKREILYIVLFLLSTSCKVTHKPTFIYIPEVADTTKIEKSIPHRVNVDTHGRALDTDKDRVPDYKDKELLTHQSCFPVDSNGIGACPEPDCCKNFHLEVGNYYRDCPLISKEIHFAPKSKELNKEAIQVLKVIAKHVKSNPTCKMRIGTYGGETKRSQTLSWDRVNAVINYLTNKETIADDRIIFGSDLGDLNIVEVIIGEDDGPNIVPIPHSKLIKGE